MPAPSSPGRDSLVRVTRDHQCKSDRHPASDGVEESWHPAVEERDAPLQEKSKWTADYFPTVRPTSVSATLRSTVQLVGNKVNGMENFIACKHIECEIYGRAWEMALT